MTKKSYTKKVTAILCAIAVFFSLAIPAFAAGANGSLIPTTGTSGSRGVSNIYIAANTAPTTSAYMPLAQYCSYSASCFATAHITGGYYRI